MRRSRVKNVLVIVSDHTKGLSGGDDVEVIGRTIRHQ
jgi:hypothetical protein